jgi:hypothetical protein
MLRDITLYLCLVSLHYTYAWCHYTTLMLGVITLYLCSVTLRYTYARCRYAILMLGDVTLYLCLVTLRYTYVCHCKFMGSPACHINLGTQSTSAASFGSCSQQGFQHNQIFWSIESMFRFDIFFKRIVCRI